MTRIERFRKDVNALEGIYGKLDGQSLTIDLMELSEICPRKYAQKKSYQGLAAFVSRTKQTTLTITSQRVGGTEDEKD